MLLPNVAPIPMSPKVWNATLATQQRLQRNNARNKKNQKIYDFYR
jgi:hypothetical protein